MGAVREKNAEGKEKRREEERRIVRGISCSWLGCKGLLTAVNPSTASPLSASDRHFSGFPKSIPAKMTLLSKGTHLARECQDRTVPMELQEGQ